MKKDRNSFFSEYNYNSMNTGMAPNMMVPNQGVSANSNFYAGPMNPNMYTDIDSRLAKIERELNRLDVRVSRLEGSTTSNIPDNSNYSSNSMYMV
jgi:hypothetical protein